MTVTIQHSDEQHRGIIPEVRLASGAVEPGMVPTATGAGEAEWATPTVAAPTTANYLVGTANAGLSAEIVVGTSPGGELGGTWASPTVDATHSGSSHAGTLSTAESYTDSAIATHEADTTSAHKLDDLATPDDNTDLNATTGHHGLLPKLGGGSANFLRADGTWNAPTAAATITTKDEGSTLSTGVTTLDFVGAGVVATGAGATTTVTISGSGANVATDAIWDTAGDLAVGSGADTAAKLALAQGSVSRVGGVLGYDSGTSFPGSPSTGDRYFRSDRGIEYYYDGTRWLSVALVPLNMGLNVDHALINTIVTGDNVGRVPIDALYDVWLVDMIWMSIVRTTNDGTKFWTVTLKKYTPGGVGTTIVTDVTSADTASQFVVHRKAIGALVQSSAHSFMQLEATKTSTPGVPDISVYLTARWVG